MTFKNSFTILSVCVALTIFAPVSESKIIKKQLTSRKFISQIKEKIARLIPNTKKTTTSLKLSSKPLQSALNRKTSEATSANQVKKFKALQRHNWSGKKTKRPFLVRLGM